MWWIRAFLISLIGIPTLGLAVEKPVEDIDKEVKVATLADPNEIKITGHDMKLRPFIIPIVKQDEIIAYASLTLILKASSDEPRILVKIVNKMPRIRDEMFQFLYSLFGVLWTPTAKPDAAFIQERLLTIGKKYCDHYLTSLEIDTLKIFQAKKLELQDKPFFVPQVVNP